MPTRMASRQPPSTYWRNIQANEQHAKALRILALVSLAGHLLVAPSPVTAEIRSIMATGEFRMGDNDSRTDAKRLALLDAKRIALEKTGTYLESVTEVRDFKVSREELRAYTAGIVEVKEQQVTSVMEGQQQIVRVDVMIQIDTDVVARQIDTLRRNESMKEELKRLRAEADRWRQEAEAQTRELATTKSKEEVEMLVSQRQRALTQAEVRELIMRGWVAMVGSPDSLLLVGSTQMEARSRAKNLIAQALKLDPDNGVGHTALGTILSEDQDYIGAVNEFRAALRTLPNDPMVHSNLGVSLQRMGKLDDAIVEHKEAIRLMPGLPVAYTNLATALTAKGDLDGAMAAYRKGISLKQIDALAHSNLALLLKLKGDIKGAEDEARTAIRYNKNLPIPHLVLGVTLKDNGKLAEAKQHLREYLRLEPNTPLNRQSIELAKSSLQEIEMIAPSASGGCATTAHAAGYDYFGENSRSGLDVVFVLLIVSPLLLARKKYSIFKTRYSMRKDGSER